MSSQPTGVSLNAKQSIWYLLISLMPLVVEVDGVAQKGTWGQQYVPLGPGTHTVSVSWKLYWIVAVQRGTTTVTLNPGETVSLRYKCRWTWILPGKLFVEPAPAAA